MSTVLVADDEAEIRELVAVTLGGSFDRVLQAADGEEALRLARAERPALVILDHHMPHRSGLEVAEQLRADTVTRTIPWIMLTGLDDDDAAQRCLEAGAKAYLTKPFSPLELLSCVEKLLRI